MSWPDRTPVLSNKASSQARCLAARFTAQNGSGGAAFAAHKAAGDAAGGVEFFLKLDAEGEEVDAVAGLVAHRDVAQHAGLAVADHGAAVGQTAHFAGLDHKRAARKGRLELAVVGEGFQSGCEFVSHRDSPSLVDFYFQPLPCPDLVQ